MAAPVAMAFRLGYSSPPRNGAGVAAKAAKKKFTGAVLTGWEKTC